MRTDTGAVTSRRPNHPHRRAALPTDADRSTSGGLQEYVVAMVRRLPPDGVPVVPGSTPVIAFGDPSRAEVATLGINPSAVEFTAGSVLLAGDDRRLATLASLGAPVGSADRRASGGRCGGLLGLLPAAAVPALVRPVGRVAAVRHRHQLLRRDGLSSRPVAVGFLLASGRYRDGDGHIRSGTLTLWGEWEPPSRIARRWPASGRLPRALHRPYWFDPGERLRRQNTDRGSGASR